MTVGYFLFSNYKHPEAKRVSTRHTYNNNHRVYFPNTITQRM
jgi:hypothetical protein